MLNKLFKSFLILILTIILNTNISYANTIEEIKIEGNKRISDETIKLFSNLSENEILDKKDLNIILKSLYETNFFKDVSISFENNILIIKVIENPIIENIIYEGIKSQKILSFIKENALIKSRSSYNEILLKKEKNRIQNSLKNERDHNHS